MRKIDIAKIEAFFNMVETKREQIVAERLQDHDFVLAHFPYHEFAARKEAAAMVVDLADFEEVRH